MNNIYDLIIIGSGPGGLSAGIYSGRAKLKTLIIEKKTFGGQILNTGVIANYPGALEEDTGASLANRMLEQCKKFGAELVKANGEAASEETDLILEKLKDRGLIVGKNGLGRNVLAFQPPLVITEENIEVLIQNLDDVLSEL